MPYIDTEQAWSQLMADLGRLLDVMVERQSLTLSVRARTHFVRVVRRSSADLRIEAVSNGYLPPADRLDLEALDLLEDLGWWAPTHFVDQVDAPPSGSTNHFVDLLPGWTGVDVASILVRTLRGVFEVPYAEDISCHSAVAPAGEAQDRPSYPIGAAHGVGLDDEILDDILGALAEVTRIETVSPVERTDRVVRIAVADGATTVLYDPAHCLVRAAVPVVSGFPATIPALLALNDCARPLRCGRLELREDTVFALIDLPALASIGTLLVGYLTSIAGNLEGLRASLEPYTIAAEA